MYDRCYFKYKIKSKWLNEKNAVFQQSLKKYVQKYIRLP